MPELVMEDDVRLEKHPTAPRRTAACTCRLFHHATVPGRFVAVIDVPSRPIDCGGLSFGAGVFACDGPDGPSVLESVLRAAKQRGLRARGRCDVVRWQRCRIWRIGAPDRLNPTGRYTELWDTLDDPYQGVLPAGQPRHEQVDADARRIHAAINEYRKENRIIVANSWRDRGRIVI